MEKEKWLPFDDSFVPSVGGTECIIPGAYRQLWYRELSDTYQMGRHIPYVMSLVVVFSFREPGLRCYPEERFSQLACEIDEFYKKMMSSGTSVDFIDMPKPFLDDTDTDTDTQDDAEDDIEMCISDNTAETYGRRKGRILFRMIPKYIKTAAVLEGLLKDMQEMKQLSDREVEEVKKQASTQRITSHLTSMVIKKGDAISENFLSKLAERDSEFYRNCSHDLDPVWRLREVQSQFAKRVSDAVIEGLLKDMLEMKVLSDEDVEEVRDAPQNTGLQPWLVEQINSGRYPGLSWTNEALKQFRIPWKHDSTPEDTMMFKDWAVATGHYREGIDKPDAAAWRRNFRFSFEKEGKYQCEITALIFDVASPAEVVYGTEQWEKCPLDQNSLLPAGPLYDINSPSGALEHLSFPHSECSKV
ncbi:UNVERIFIED_CONTAM: hypothetical protein FKN15_038223 [Acipenser sinensis]